MSNTPNLPMYRAAVETLEQRRLLSADVFTAEPAYAPAGLNVEFAPGSTDHQWQAVARRPAFGEEGMSAVLNNRLYTFGGYKDSNYRTDRGVFSYDPATNNWQGHPSLPGKLTHAGTAVDPDHADRVYFVAGYLGDHPAVDTNKVWQFNATTERYAQLPDLPIGRGGGGSAVVGDTLYHMGGHTRTLGRETVEVFALDLNNPAAGWARRADMPIGMNSFATVAIGQDIWVLGGQIGEDEGQIPQRGVYRYDTDTDTWHTQPSLPRGMDHQTAQVFVKNGLISLIGGEYDHNEPVDQWYVYDPATGQTTTRVPLPDVRRGGYAGVIGDTIIHTGGWNQYHRSDTWTISTDALGTGNNDHGGNDNGGNDNGGNDGGGNDGGGNDGGGSNDNGGNDVSLDLNEAIRDANEAVVESWRQLGPFQFPDYTGSDGRWVTADRHHWTSGFWPGVVRQISLLTGDAGWAAKADHMARDLARGDSYADDITFRRMTALLPLANDPAVRQALLGHVQAKQSNWNATVGAYSTNWRSSSSGDPRANFGVLMDQTNDLDLLLWAANVTDDPELVRRAYSHASVVANHLVRNDGSSAQWAYFDRDTGDFVTQETAQGYANNSTWARGQAWGMLAFTRLAHDAQTRGLATEAAQFEQTAMKLADFWLANVPDSMVPKWDFSAPGNQPIDTSAAAIAGAALVDLAELTNDLGYREAANATAASLAENFHGFGQPEVSQLTGGSGHVPANIAVDVGLIYGDYYYLRLLNRLAGKTALDDPFAAGNVKTAGFTGNPTPGNNNGGGNDDGGGSDNSGGNDEGGDQDGGDVTGFTIEAGPRLPISYVESQSATLRGQSYRIGGFNNSWQPRFESYRLENGQWRQLRDIPEAITHAAVAADDADGRLWLVGGYLGKYGGDGRFYGQTFGVSRVWYYDVGRERFMIGPSLPVDRAAGGAEIVGRTLYFFGGETRDRRADARDTYALDLDNPSAGWTRKADMPLARNSFATAVHNGKIYAFGGQSGFDHGMTTHAQTMVYDPATDRWTMAASMPAGRSHQGSAAVTTRGHAVLFGGLSAHNVPERDVFAYDFAANQWQTIGQFDQPRASLGGTLMDDNRIILTGGFGNGGQRFTDTLVVTLT
jgi:unsaturated chondroitin disaccharide hydrolase